MYVGKTLFAQIMDSCRGRRSVASSSVTAATIESARFSCADQFR